MSIASGSVSNRVDGCRSCGHGELIELVNLGSIHLSGHFPEPGKPIGHGELALIGCFTEGGCGLVQLSTSYNQDLLYGANYGYRSGLNASMVSHLKNKVETIIKRWTPVPQDLIIDVGSNDGTTLSMYPESFLDLNGVDPTAAKFATYYPAHVKTFPSLFNSELVSSSGWAGKAKVISSFSMFYDLPSPVAFMRDVRAALREDGVWVSEQSYLPSMLRANSFDTICHEHLEYYSLRNIVWMAETAGLKVIHCEFNEINGGSFSFTAATDSSPFEIDSSVALALEEEKDFELQNPKTYTRFQREIDRHVMEFRRLLDLLSSQGSRIAALGASTKGNVFLEYAKLDSSSISVIGDVNPDKWGKVTPGTSIPITDENIVLDQQFDYYVVLPWHFKDFFLKKFRGSGLRLIFPLPQVEVVQC